MLPSSPHNRVIKLTNIIASKDISENLLSLRQLADRGLSIYLDDMVLRVYDKQTDETILRRIYKKPNWLVKFKVQKNFRTNRDNHCYIIKIVTSNEIANQSQTYTESESWEGEIDKTEHGYTGF